MLGGRGSAGRRWLGTRGYPWDVYVASMADIGQMIVPRGGAAHRGDCACACCEGHGTVACVRVCERSYYGVVRGRSSSQRSRTRGVQNRGDCARARRAGQGTIGCVRACRCSHAGAVRSRRESREEQDPGSVAVVVGVALAVIGAGRRV